MPSKLALEKKAHYGRLLKTQDSENFEVYVASKKIGREGKRTEIELESVWAEVLELRAASKKVGRAKIRSFAEARADLELEDLPTEECVSVTAHP